MCEYFVQLGSFLTRFLFISGQENSLVAVKIRFN